MTGGIGEWDRAVRERLLAAVAAGTTVVAASSPPGAGKTSLVVAAVHAAALAGQRVAVVTNTSNQGAEVVARLAAVPGAKVGVVYALGGKAVLPGAVGDLERAGAVTVVRPLKDLPDGPGIVVGCAAKWLHHPHADPPPFDLVAVEEAAQLPRHLLVLLGNLGRRHLPVGDEGQIQPFSQVSQQRWAGDPLGPLVPALGTLPVLAPRRAAFELPVSHRLPQDTVDVVGPALYPRLRFVGGSGRLERRLVPGRGALPATLGEAATTGSVVLAELPWHGALSHVDLDAESAAAAARVAAGLLHGGTVVEPGVPAVRLTADQVAVACARRDQAAAVRNLLRSLLPPGSPGPRVDTANRLQGLTYQVVVAIHPLAGTAGPGAFTLEPGRLSVMLSRHRICCVVVGREGMADRLADHVPDSPRFLGDVPDAEHAGWKAHARVLDGLADRTVQADLG